MPIGQENILLIARAARNMSGEEFRARLKRLRSSFSALAPLLGLSPDGLHEQMNGSRSVSRQTELLVERLEADAASEVVVNGKRPG